MTAYCTAQVQQQELKHHEQWDKSGPPHNTQAHYMVIQFNNSQYVFDTPTCLGERGGGGRERESVCVYIYTTVNRI